MRSTVQNAKFHAMIDDIARQVKFAGRYWKPASWKRLMVQAYVNIEREFAEAIGDPDPFPGPSMVIVGIDGESVVTLGEQTRRFTAEQMAGLIESTYAHFALSGVVWSERSQ